MVCLVLQPWKDTEESMNLCSLCQMFNINTCYLLTATAVKGWICNCSGWLKKMVKKKNFWDSASSKWNSHQDHEAIINLCFYCFSSSVTPPVSLPRAPLWGRQASSTVSESCETHKCLASTRRVCFHRWLWSAAVGQRRLQQQDGSVLTQKNWRVPNLEHGVTSFEMGGTTSIIDPLRARRRWVIERRSISDPNPKTSAAQLPRQRLFLPRRLTAHSLICRVSPPSPLPSLFSWSMASPCRTSVYLKPELFFAQQPQISASEFTSDHNSRCVFCAGLELY